jgi:hypothetical protein
MMNLAIWLKRTRFSGLIRCKPSTPAPWPLPRPCTTQGATPCAKSIAQSETADEAVDVVRGEKRRRLHKAFLRYHDPNNWPLLREALKTMGRVDLIGNGKHHLIPTFQPLTDGGYQSARKKNSTSATTVASRPEGKPQGKPTAGQPLGKAPRTTSAGTQPGKAPGVALGLKGKQPVRGQILTQHTGLPPRSPSSETRQAQRRSHHPQNVLIKPALGLPTQRGVAMRG